MTSPNIFRVSQGPYYVLSCDNLVQDWSYSSWTDFVFESLHFVFESLAFLHWRLGYIVLSCCFGNSFSKPHNLIHIIEDEYAVVDSLILWLKEMWAVFNSSLRHVLTSIEISDIMVPQVAVVNLNSLEFWCIFAVAYESRSLHSLSLVDPKDVARLLTTVS